jgi:hypothetical protein
MEAAPAFCGQLRITRCTRSSQWSPTPSTNTTAIWSPTVPAGRSKARRQHVMRSDVAHQRNFVRQTDRQPAISQTVCAGISLPQTQAPPSPSSISPACRSRFAVATTSPRKPVGAPVASPAQRRRQDGHVQFQADQMERPVQRGNPARGIGDHAVFLEAARGVIVRRLERDVTRPSAGRWSPLLPSRCSEEITSTWPA